MNLGRAKLILVIAFAALNLFLGYHLFWPDFGRLTRVAVSAEELRLTEQMLAENNYRLEVPINRAIQTIDFLTVSQSLAVQRAVLLRFLREGARISQAEKANYYYIDGETAVIHASGLITIRYNPPILLGENLINRESREIRNVVDAFLAANQLYFDGLSFDYLEKDDPSTIVVYYNQIIDDVPVFAGQLKVTIVDDKIQSVDLYWLEPAERDPAREIRVISAAEALSNLVYELGPAAELQLISKVELGYYSGDYDAEKWEIPPVWRILINGQHYYINAFTGNLEQEIIIPEQLQ
jgi:regulatory protein YycI of two-component signal transduction system YycFG